MESSWRPLVSSIFQGWASGTIMLNIVINYQDDSAECTLREFAADTKLGGVAILPFQRHLNRLEKWWKWEIMGTSWSSPRWSAEFSIWEGTIPCTSIFQKLANRKAAWQKRIWWFCWTPGWTQASNVPFLQSRLMTALGKTLPSGQGKGSFLPAQHWQGHVWCPLSCFRHASAKEIWTHWRESSKDHLTYEERLRELQLFAPERKPGEILSMYMRTWGQSAKRTEPDSFLSCPFTGPEAMSTNQKSKRFLCTSGNTSILWRWQHWHRLSRWLWSLHPGTY